MLKVYLRLGILFNVVEVMKLDLNVNYFNLFENYD